MFKFGYMANLFTVSFKFFWSVSINPSLVNWVEFCCTLSFKNVCFTTCIFFNVKLKFAVFIKGIVVPYCTKY